MAVTIYNTLTRKKEEIKTREPGKVLAYVCGPTVYNYIHVGNARTFLVFDVIRRYLEFRDYEVVFVQNITDVDDRIINQAKEEGVEPEKVAKKYLDAYEEDMDALGVRMPTIAPKATEHIEEMVKIIGVLLDKGYAYVVDGDVFYEIDKFSDYGKLSGRALEDLRAGERVEIDPRKKSPQDFALWKSSKPGEPSWESPWGPGRPGWHIECSAMSLKYLGQGFDIHGGGQDLIFPHHENEIAQSEAYADGARFVNCWIHSGMLIIEREKMSKSLGNITLLRDVLEEHEADVVRLMMLGTHYRSPLSYSDEKLEEAERSLDRIRTCFFNLEDLLRRMEKKRSSPVPTVRENEIMAYFETAEERFRKAMDDDFNTAAALAVIFDLVKELNTFVEEQSSYATPAGKLVLIQGKDTLKSLLVALGLLQAKVPAGVPAGEAAGVDEGEGPGSYKLIELLLEVREIARTENNWELADFIRQKLTEMGVKVEDVRGGHRYRIE